jgi:hypothetical protein
MSLFVRPHIFESRGGLLNRLAILEVIVSLDGSPQENVNPLDNIFPAPTLHVDHKTLNPKSTAS